MAEPGDNLDTDYEPPKKERPWGTIAAVVAFILLGLFAFWVTHEKKNDQARQEVLAALDKELTDDEGAIKAQRDKVMELTRQVESLRASIASGQVENGKAAVARFKELVAQQRAERDKFTQMADVYNKKVAQYRSLEQ
jgi:ribosomal protein L17